METAADPRDMGVAMPAQDDAIEVENLVVRYGAKRAVDALSLSVPAGSVFGFVGVNGAGKTSTIKALLGLRRTEGGAARVLGMDAATRSIDVRARVGYASEEDSLYGYLTIPQTCAYLRATSRRWDQATVDRYLELFDLPPRAKVGKLSKGERSQLALCLAMGGDPDLLILDEPTSGLDPVARRHFLSALVGEVAAAGKTVFFSSHILSDVETVCDRVAIIRAGRLVLSDEVDELRRTRRILRLTYAAPPPPEEVEALRRLPGATDVRVEGRSVRVRIAGAVEEATSLAGDRPYTLRDLDVVVPTFEEICLGYMQEKADAR